VTQLEKAIAGFEDRLPRQGEIDVILREVWVLADAAGLKTQSIKTQKGRQQDAYKVLPIEVRLQGDFAGLYKFLLSLEKLPGVMNVESLKLQMTPAEGSELVDVGFVLHVYCRG
jgi:Tfp pilus assembly protein PilO